MFLMRKRHLHATCCTCANTFTCCQAGCIHKSGGILFLFYFDERKEKKKKEEDEHDNNDADVNVDVQT